MKKTVLVFIFLAASLTICVVPVFGDGGGGIFMGYHVDIDIDDDNLRVDMGNPGYMYSGGYGYGVSGYQINGGFGYYLEDKKQSGTLSGGFGGVISGIRILKMPLNVNLVSWTGFGAVQQLTGDVEKTAFCISEEIALEIGLPVFRWFMPIVYAGYTASMSLSPNSPGEAYVAHNPVLGIRLVWGKFY